MTNESFRFLDLPAELRNAIYDETLIRPTPIKLGPEMCISALQGNSTKNPAASWKIPPLLHTTRQIRTEAMDIYLSNNIFVFDQRDDPWTICEAGLYSVVHTKIAPTLRVLTPEHRLAVRRIRVLGLTWSLAQEAQKMARSYRVVLQQEEAILVTPGVLAVPASSGVVNQPRWSTEETEAVKA